jgi:hypothetical protein
VKKLLVFVLAIVFMTALAYADEKGKPCSETCKVKCAAGKATAQATGTEAKAADAVKVEAVPAVAGEKAPAAVEAPKLAETCPDVHGEAALEAFHEAMHPMHMALEDGKYADLRKGYPELLKASEGIKGYSCPMSDKCPPECKKAFDDKKTGLLKDVEALGVACNGTDDKKVEASFMSMHEAYIGFASMCKHEKPAEEKK